MGLFVGTANSLMLLLEDDEKKVQSDVVQIQADVTKLEAGEKKQVQADVNKLVSDIYFVSTTLESNRA